MPELILHHYAMSPFSEKIRLIFGLKRLAWRGVAIPQVMPKPDVIALTGGYRKTPVLQIGADVYCDTALIARVLDAQQPKPTLYPAELPMAVPLAQWADSFLFQELVVWAMQPAGIPSMGTLVSPDQLKIFAADRAAMRGSFPRPTLSDGTAQLKAHLSTLEAQLAKGGPWLLGSAPCIADFSVAHCFWFIRLAKPVATLLAQYPAVSSWLDKVSAIGHHTHEEMGGSDAIAVATAAKSHVPATVAAGEGFESGEAVTVSATDYGTDAVAGTLVGLSNAESVIRRVDPRAGTVHVHFPRFGYQIKKSTPA